MTEALTPAYLILFIIETTVILTLCFYIFWTNRRKNINEENQIEFGCEKQKKMCIKCNIPVSRAEVCTISQLRQCQASVCTYVDNIYKALVTITENHQDCHQPRANKQNVSLKQLKEDIEYFKSISTQAIQEVEEYCRKTVSNGSIPKETQSFVTNEMREERLANQIYDHFSTLEETDNQTTHEHNEELQEVIEKIGEEQFFDAVESNIEIFNESALTREILRRKSFRQTPIKYRGPLQDHPLWSSINQIVQEQIYFCQLGTEEGIWTPFGGDKKIQMFRRQVEENGVVLDSIKISTIINGASSKEITYLCTQDKYKHEYVTTLIEKAEELETISENTKILYEKYKRVWPVAARDSLYFLHRTQVKIDKPDVADAWITTISTIYLPQYKDMVPNDSKTVRLNITFNNYCETYRWEGPATRDKLRTLIVLSGVVNPGSWVPPALFRALYKRELYSYMSRLVKFIQKKTKDAPVFI